VIQKPKFDFDLPEGREVKSGVVPGGKLRWFLAVGGGERNQKLNATGDVGVGIPTDQTEEKGVMILRFRRRKKK